MDGRRREGNHRRHKSPGQKQHRQVHQRRGRASGHRFDHEHSNEGFGAMKAPNGKHLSFPFRIGKDGRTAEVNTLEEHVRDELIQLLLTNLGERPFLAEFGGGLRRLVFEPADETSAAVTKAMVTQAVSNWLGHRVTLELLDVQVENETIQIDLKYRIAGTEDSRILRFQRKGG